MGLFCVNFHFRTTDDKALSDALERRGVKRYRIVPAKTGWTSLYEEQASEQDDRQIRELGGGLSKDLQVAAIAFLVHDSDIACYWLYENGKLIDEYNSDPDYFGETDGPPKPSGGRPEILVRYCPSVVQQAEIAKILSQESVRRTTFAERVIERLAKALGIAPNLAIADFRDEGHDDGPGNGDEPDDDDGDYGDDDAGPTGSSLPPALVKAMSKRFGFDLGDTPADPQAKALVHAAAGGNTDEIARLLADGVAIDAEAPGPVPTGQLAAGLAQFFPGGAPQVVMTALLAAVVNKQQTAARRLLEGGANPNHIHQRYGTPVHAAAGAGEAEMLKLLIDNRGDVNARNAQGQTPLQAIAASRAAMDRVVQLQAALKSMSVNLPSAFGKMANVSLPTEGWNACEQLLIASGAQ
jgi:hypothetical protein